MRFTKRKLSDKLVLTHQFLKRYRCKHFEEILQLRNQSYRESVSTIFKLTEHQQAKYIYMCDLSKVAHKNKGKRKRGQTWRCIYGHASSMQKKPRKTSNHNSLTHTHTQLLCNCSLGTTRHDQAPEHAVNFRPMGAGHRQRSKTEQSRH